MFFVVMYTPCKAAGARCCQGTTCEKQCTYQCMCMCRPAAVAAAVVLYVGKGRTGGQAAPQQGPVCFLSCCSSAVLISSPTLPAASGCRGARPALPEWCAGKSLASPTGEQSSQRLCLYVLAWFCHCTPTSIGKKSNI